MTGGPSLRNPLSFVSGISHDLDLGYKKQIPEFEDLVVNKAIALNLKLRQRSKLQRVKG
jgi:hypothetical protein